MTAFPFPSAFERLLLRLSNRLFLRVMFWLYFGFMCYLSCMPHTAVDANFSTEVQQFDNFAHLGLYAIFSFVGTMAWLPNPCSPAEPRLPILPRLRGEWLERLALASLTSCLGSVLELLQATPLILRACSTADATANTLGAFFGVLLAPSFAPAPKRN